MHLRWHGQLQRTKDAWAAAMVVDVQAQHVPCTQGLVHRKGMILALIAAAQHDALLLKQGWLGPHRSTLHASQSVNGGHVWSTQWG
jgi:hypothetical protein